MYGMDDEGIFEQLFKMLETSGPVNWKLAREVTKSLSGQPEPVDQGRGQRRPCRQRSVQLHDQRMADPRSGRLPERRFETGNAKNPVEVSVAPGRRQTRAANGHASLLPERAATGQVGA